MASLKITELDFDDIKTNLKTFLKSYTDENGNQVFSDYEFEGSSLSVLIDLLAYNTHYNAYYTNMLANEMFLDTAVKRESAVSIAKHIGYTPTSVRGARALITFDVTNPTGNPDTLTLEKYTAFTTTVNEQSLTFVNLDPVTIEKENGVYRFSNVEIVEGTPVEFVHRVYNPGPAEKYEVPNENIDTTSLRVIVQNSFSDTTSTAYTLADDITTVTSTSNVYYIEENSSGRYQIYFGDGVLGRKLVPANLIRLQYLISNGTVGNIAGDVEQTFSSAAIVGGGTILSEITASQNSTGGAPKENIDSIKFKAPKFFASYNRAVTADDYKAIIQTNYPTIESVSVWGGEDNTPPIYGKVFISLKPFDDYTISSTVKENIKRELLANRRIMAIVPEIIDPEFIYIGISTAVKYNKTTASITSDQIKTAVDNAIRLYFSNNLQKFDNDFIFSKLSKIIDESDPSIIGNETKLKIQKRIVPNLNKENVYDITNPIKFTNKIVPGTIQSTNFNYYLDGIVYRVKILDTPNQNPANFDGDGTLKLVDYTEQNILIPNLGTINYKTGEMLIPSLQVYGFVDDTPDIRFNAEPQSYDIISQKNQILVIDNSTTNTTANRMTGLKINVSAV